MRVSGADVIVTGPISLDLIVGVPHLPGPGEAGLGGRTRAGAQAGLPTRETIAGLID